MNSFILIDGIAFWILFIVFLIGFIAFIILGNGYLAAQRKIDSKDRQLKKLRSQYNRLIGEYQMAIFKVPALNEEKADDK